MISAFLDRCAAVFGRPLSRGAAAAALVGLVGLILGGALGHSGPAVACLASSFLFFGGLAAGAVALSAAIRVAQGRWARELLPLADACAGFFLPALAVLAVVVFAGRAYLPWLSERSAAALWAFAVRELVATGALFLVGWRYTLLSRATPSGGAAVGRAAVVYLLCFAAVLCLWAFDLVMRAIEGAPSTVIPFYYLLGAFLSGLAFVGFVASLRGRPGPETRYDVGKLLFGFIIVWSYLLWAAFLPTWYGNIPDETGVLLARWRGVFKPASAFVLVAVFAWPFWLLFPEGLKRRRATLAVGAGLVLGGLLVERFLLVLPSLSLAGGGAGFLVGAAVTVGVLGLFVLAVGARLASVEALRRPGG